MYKDLGFILQTNDKTEQVPAALLLILFVYKDKDEKINAHAHTTWSSVSRAFVAVFEALPQGRNIQTMLTHGLSLSLT